MGTTPTQSQRVIYWVFGPLWSAGTQRNSGPGSKTEKRNFPVLGALFGRKKYVRPKSISQKLRNFFTRPPRAGNRKKGGFLGPFGLGQSLAFNRNYGPKTEKTQFPGARRTFVGKICPPQKFLRKIAQPVYILCFGRPEPQGQEIAKYGFSRPFWRRAALGI